MSRNLPLPFACTAVLLGSVAFAADQPLKVNMSNWDADSDRRISAEEWTATLERHRVFDKIDRNNNDAFDDAEAAGELLEFDTSFDKDAGGRIDREEFTRGLFSKLDANADGRLDDMEWAEFASSSDGSPLFN